jgi:hypothetical protein
VKTALELLSRRIIELDDTSRSWGLPAGWELSGDRLKVYILISHFARVISVYTDTLMDCEVGCKEILNATTADEMVRASRMLAEITEYEPGLTTGPLRSNQQHWTRTGRHLLPPEDIPISLEEERFIVPSVDTGQRASVKPSYLGLYTSTATSAGCSMWRALLGPYDSMMYPLPWHTWELEVNADIKIAEITSASSWVELVCSHGRASKGFLYPDWLKIAREFDAVHITLPAIAAAQGFYFSVPAGVIPPTFWDVETTFWLRWCFSGARLVETRDVASTRLLS